MRHLQVKLLLTADVFVKDNATDDDIYNTIVRYSYNVYGYEPKPEEIYEISETIS